MTSAFFQNFRHKLCFRQANIVLTEFDYSHLTVLNHHSSGAPLTSVSLQGL